MTDTHEATDLLCFENVTYAYASDDEQTPARQVLCGVDLRIPAGSFVAVLGHNGSGKSTLAKLCNGLYVPTQGRVLVAGLDTADEANQLTVRQTVGLVFQNPDNQLVSSIVEEDVAFGPENLGVPVAELRPRVEQALEAVGMLDYARHDTHKLSGGQKQRVAIAGVLAMRPRCLVLDEPTAMLDPRGRSEVMQAVRRLHEQNGMTVVLITHYMEEAALAQRVVVMDEGRLLLDGTPDAVFAQTDALRSTGLEMPPTAALCHALIRAGMPLPRLGLTVEDTVELLSSFQEE